MIICDGGIYVQIKSYNISILTNLSASFRPIFVFLSKLFQLFLRYDLEIEVNPQIYRQLLSFAYISYSCSSLRSITSMLCTHVYEMNPSTVRDE